MSEESNQEVVLPEVPADVVELQKTLGELNAFHKAALHATYSGAHTKAAADLIKFLFESYNQVLKQFDQHPFVVSERAKVSKE
jgi:hypothetical protein